MKTSHFIVTISGCALATISFGSMLLQEAQATTEVRASSKTARVVKPSSCANPRGVRLTIYGFWQVTNSEDGFRDNNVEMYGSVKFNGQHVWRVAKQNAISSRDRRNSINTASRTFDVIFDNPATWTLRVNGFLYDYDKGSDDEPMWNPRQQNRLVNIKRMSDLSKDRRDARVYLSGDRESESADLCLLISKSEDIF